MGTSFGAYELHQEGVYMRKSRYRFRIVCSKLEVTKIIMNMFCNSIFVKI